MKALEHAVRAYEPQNLQEAGDKAAIISCMEVFGNLLDRSNLVAHFTGSAWIVNRERTKTLMVYHNLYRSWSWTGGHADGEADLLSVAIREALEETGIMKVKPLFEGIFALDILPVWSHMRKGLFVPSHLHLNAAFLVEADEADPLAVREEENSDVKWIPIDDANRYSTEPDMHPVYNKLTMRLQAIRA
jgi:8-oxo-dGTP pyrophosphatase MutT (NUDIX family)